MKLPKALQGFLIAITASVLWATPVPAAEFAPGVTQITIPSDEREKDLAVKIWYPATEGGAPVMLGDNVFFHGTEAMLDAPAAKGPFPLILLSHGAGLAGRAEAMSWIATPLAQQGYVVAAPTHPGNTGPDRSAEETMRLWRRAADLSGTLDALESAPPIPPEVDLERVGVLGLSMGGHTALAIAGARIDPDRYSAYCDDDAGNPSLCQWVRMSGVDLRAMDVSSVAADMSDPRIALVIAIDPAPVDIFADESLAEVDLPVTLVNLGKAGDIPSTANAAPVAQAIPGAGFHRIEGADHASMFAECKPNAAQIARDEGIEDKICPEAGDRPRGDVHAELIEMVLERFDEALGTDAQ